jgi:hypothetical protein
MTHLERFTAAMNRQPVDRLPRVEWAPWWDLTVKEWHEQGLPTDLDFPRGILAHFGLDIWQRIWIRPLDHSKLPPAPYHGGPMINSEAEYEKYLTEGGIFPKPERIIDQSFCDRLRSLQQMQDNDELMLWLTFDGFFWLPRTLMGIEAHMFAFYDQPKLMHRINQTNVDHQLRMFEIIMNLGIKPGFVCVAEDLSYNNGPMLSKAQWDEFIAPYYQQVNKVYHDAGLPVILDSDGDISMMVPWMQEAGIDGVLPLERQAGVDVNAIRKQHPDFMMIGAYDKMVMSQGESAMRAEFDRLLPAMRSGAFIPSVDHQTPPGVTLDNYRTYVDLLFEYTQLAATPSPREG